MKAHICDRCKTAYVKNLVETNGRILGGHLGGFNLISTNGDVDACVDLCDSCLKDLETFMNDETIYKREKVL